MVDTVKLEIPITDLTALYRAPFAPLSVSQLYGLAGRSASTKLNPPRNSMAKGVYAPRLTLHRRPRAGMGVTYPLYVEFSAPKLVFKNNFDELKESDFPMVLTALQKSLFDVLGVTFPLDQLASANVSAWHPSKNIVFLGYTQTQTIIDTIGKLDISKRRDVGHRDWRDGHIIHIHTNSRDIAFYDKKSDLERSRISPKYSFEKDSELQLSLLSSLEEQKTLQVLRYEVRHVNRSAVKRAYPALPEWTFESLFRQDLSKEVLQKHWNDLSGSINMLALDVDKPLELLQNYLEANDDTTPQRALAAVCGLLVNGQVGVRQLQNTIEKRFGKHAWYRLKPLFVAPKKQRYEAFTHIDEALAKFTPVRLSDYLK